MTYVFLLLVGLLLAVGAVFIPGNQFYYMSLPGFFIVLAGLGLMLKRLFI